MEVRLAKTAGFCFGVKRAVDTVYEEIEKGDGSIFTFGPIVHNEQVIEDLEQKGVHVLSSVDEFDRVGNGTVIIRAHGIGRHIYELMDEKQIRYVDATCPFVKKIHRHVEKHSAEGYHILIAGNPTHPEVEGIKGWCSGPVTVLQTLEDAAAFKFNENERFCLVSQTTFNYKKFKELVEIIEQKAYNVVVLNTICSATEERQTEARLIAAEVDAMIVIGGRSSSNTQKLFEICKKECENTYYIQKLVDLDLGTASSIRSVGITAGASTPSKIIEEVQTYVRNEF